LFTHLAITLSSDDGKTVTTGKNPEFPKLENSQCAIESDYAGYAVPISFKASFSGLKTIYARATNGAGATTGWVKQGTWTVSENEPPAAIAATPYLGSADHQVFSLTFADANGAGDLDKLEAVFAFEPRDAQACHLIVDRVANRVSVVGGNSAQLGNASTLTSPLCTVTGVHVVEERGRMLRLSADVHFTSAMKGRRNIFLKSTDRSKLESAWLWAGSWLVP
jgi:hypothetical protein